MEKKVFSVLLTVALATGVLAGCGSSAATGNNAATGAAQNEGSQTASATTAGEESGDTIVIRSCFATGMTGAVNRFAIEKGLVTVKEGMTTVRIYNTNTDKVIAADVKTEGGKVVYQGDFKIAGVPVSASPIKLKFIDPAGTLKKGLLPTGRCFRNTWNGIHRSVHH